MTRHLFNIKTRREAQLYINQHVESGYTFKGIRTALSVAKHSDVPEIKKATKLILSEIDRQVNGLSGKVTKKDIAGAILMLIVAGIIIIAVFALVGQ